MCFLFTFAWITRNIWTKPETRRLNLTDSFSLFFAVSSAFILSSLAYYEPVLSAVHPWTVQVPPSLIEHTVATFYIITRPHLQPNKCCCHILCQRHIDDPIFSLTISFPFSFFPLFFVLKARPYSQRIPPAPESGLHSVHRTLFFPLLYLSCVSRFFFFFSL